jgi:hypothetical protein
MDGESGMHSADAGSLDESIVPGKSSNRETPKDKV